MGMMEADPMDCVLCGCVLNCDGQCTPPPSQRFIDAFARGEVTKGGMAEAGWFEIGTIVGDCLQRKAHT